MRNASIYCLIIAGLSIAACSKYKDPPRTGLDDRLDKHYCNDPRSVNYNWGFPGIPDSTICIYPVDPFLGTWIFTDSVSRQGGDSVTVQVKTLVFASTEDTVLTHMAVHGLCSDSEPFYITANKHGFAYVDSLFEFNAGQLFCSSGDTLTGFINFNTDSAAITRGTLMFNLSVSSADGIIYHKGAAVKQ